MLFLIKYSPKYRELRVLEDRLKETKDELKIASEMQNEDIKTQNPYYRLKIRVDRAAHFVKCAKAQCDLEMEVLAYKDGMHMKAYERYLLDYEMFDNQIEVMITNPPRENQAFTFTTKRRLHSWRIASGTGTLTFAAHRSQRIWPSMCLAFVAGMHGFGTRAPSTRWHAANCTSLMSE
jgi:hypothetical protein